MECRPFKDPGFDLVRMEHDMGVQAVPVETEAAVQATALQAKAGSTQYEARQMAPETASVLAASDSLGAFLETVAEHTEYALQQNEVMNLFEDAYAALAEEVRARAPSLSEPSYLCAQG